MSVVAFFTTFAARVAFAGGFVLAVVLVYKRYTFSEDWFSCFGAASYAMPVVVVYANWE